VNTSSRAAAIGNAVSAHVKDMHAQTRAALDDFSDTFWTLAEVGLTDEFNEESLDGVGDELAKILGLVLATKPKWERALARYDELMSVVLG